MEAPLQQDGARVLARIALRVYDGPGIPGLVAARGKEGELPAFQVRFFEDEGGGDAGNQVDPNHDGQRASNAPVLPRSSLGIAILRLPRRITSTSSPAYHLLAFAGSPLFAIAGVPPLSLRRHTTLQPKERDRRSLDDARRCCP